MTELAALACVIPSLLPARARCVCARLAPCCTRTCTHAPTRTHSPCAATHFIFGERASATGVRHPGELRRLCREAALSGATKALLPYPALIFTDPGQVTGFRQHAYTSSGTPSPQPPSPPASQALCCSLQTRLFLLLQANGLTSPRPSLFAPLSQDLDDELAMVALRALVEGSHLRPIGLVANMHPSLARARLAKGTLISLGMASVPVAVGTDGGCLDHSDHFSETAAAYMAGEAEVERDWLGMCQRVLSAEADGSVLVVCLSSFTDVSQLLAAHEALCVAKVHSFTIMGGVTERQPSKDASKGRRGSVSWAESTTVPSSGLPHGRQTHTHYEQQRTTAAARGRRTRWGGRTTTAGASARGTAPDDRIAITTTTPGGSERSSEQRATTGGGGSETGGKGGGGSETGSKAADGERQRTSLGSLGSLMPDSANNNTFDMASAKRFYEHVQRLGLRLTILTRFAAYSAPVERSIYDAMAETGSPVALRLKRVQKSSIEDLWKRACSSDAEGRRGLPERCDKQWFCRTFCNGEGGSRTRDDSMWDLVTCFNVYDALTLIASVPHLQWVFFDPEAPVGPMVPSADPVRVIGLSESQTGLKFPPERLMRFLRETARPPARPPAHLALLCPSAFATGPPHPLASHPSFPPTHLHNPDPTSSLRPPPHPGAHSGTALLDGIQLSNSRWEPPATVQHLSSLLAGGRTQLQALSNPMSA